MQAEPKSEKTMRYITNVLKYVIGGGKSCASTLLYPLALLLLPACNEDTPVSPDPENLIETPAADSTAVGDSIFVDPAWGDTIDYNFDGNGEVTIPVSGGDVEEGDAGEAV